MACFCCLLFCVLPRFIIVIHIRRTVQKKNTKATHSVVLVVACPSALRLVPRCCFCACRVRHNKNLFQKLKKKREMRIKLPEIRAIQFAVSFSLCCVLDGVGRGERWSRALWGIAYAPRNPAVRLLAPFDLIFALWLLLFHLALAGVKNYSYLVRNAYESVCFCMCLFLHVCVCMRVCVAVRLFFGRACGLAARTLGALDMHRPFFKMVALPFSRHPSLSLSLSSCPICGWPIT